MCRPSTGQRIHIGTCARWVRRGPTAKEGVLVASGITEDRAKERLECALSDLAERDAVSEVREGIHVHCVVGWGILQEML